MDTKRMFEISRAVFLSFFSQPASQFHGGLVGLLPLQEAVFVLSLLLSMRALFSLLLLVTRVGAYLTFPKHKLTGRN